MPGDVLSVLSSGNVVGDGVGRGPGHGRGRDVALAVAWQTYSQRGPLIEITFDNASGIAAGEGSSVHPLSMALG